eukprot:TRINITY_DN829_c1_g2_i1.p1 TRINITY_DN829_c1_g2~~TRINITY_DN829_c1_g2_i1.p1  ORF type:complete len:460 (-),score=77.42 TRINITY_DN829_c1_g2_i1:38-1417(-)
MKRSTRKALLLLTLQYLQSGIAAPQLDAHEPKALALATQFATAHIAKMQAVRPEDQLLLNALKNHGASTERQLQVLFRKCITPGARIVLGVLGGSISAFEDVSYQYPLGKFLRGLCPFATVEVHNGARAAHGSLTVGMCARCGLGQHVDMLILEFSLNDWSHYHRHNETACTSYELALRTALTSFQHAPAVLGLFFWGPYFTKQSAQDYHEPLCKHYGVTGISMRDLVWPYIEAQKAPWTKRTDVCSDSHHPTPVVHLYTANLIALYISGVFLDWSKNVTVTAPTRRLSSLLPPPALPKPISPELGRLDLIRGKLKCKWSIDPVYGAESKLELYENEGWSVQTRPPCVHFTSANSTVLVPVETQQGVLIMSNCFRVPGYWETGPAFQVYLLEQAADDNGKSVVSRSRVNLEPLVHQSGESFIADPPLSPGRHVLEVLPSPDCTPDERGRCGGFYAVVTL